LAGVGVANPDHPFNPAIPTFGPQLSKIIETRCGKRACAGFIGFQVLLGAGCIELETRTILHIRQLSAIAARRASGCYISSYSIPPQDQVDFSRPNDGCVERCLRSSKGVGRSLAVQLQKAGQMSEISKRPGFLGGKSIFRLVFLCQQTLILTCATLNGRTL
jgi:hypothetical protein